MSEVPYAIEFTRAAKRDLRNLGKGKTEEALKILYSELRTNPEKGGRLSGNLTGVRSLHFSLRGSGQYRAAYYILEERELTCLVFYVGSRENFYEGHSAALPPSIR